MNNLTLIVAIPFLAALGLCLLPRREKDLVQPVAAMARAETMTAGRGRFTAKPPLHCDTRP